MLNMLKKILTMGAALLALGACSRDNTVLMCDDGTSVRVQPVTENIIRISAVPGKDFSSRPSLMVVPRREKAAFKSTLTPAGLEVRTSALTVKVSKADGRVSFFDAGGAPVSSEDRREFTPVTVEGRQGYSVRQVWESPADEAFYGLGQQQDFLLNRKGDNVDLYQYNTKISCPFIMSDRGYGILWDSYSWSRFGNPSGYVQLGKVLTLYDKEGNYGHLTGTYVPASGERLVRQEDSLFFEDETAIRNLPEMPLKGATVTYEGYIQAPRDGNYRFQLYYAGFQSVEIGGREVVDEVWRPAWNPNIVKFTVALKAGEKTPLCVNWRPDGDVSYTGLRVAPYRTPEEQSKLSLWSEMNPEVDYYFIAGPSADEVISGYRTLTGKAQVMPRWVMGFWQSRERYVSQDEIVSTLKEFRDRHIPVDNIVQDWQYWKPDQWGSHEFDETRFPDPEAMLDDIRADPAVEGEQFQHREPLLDNGFLHREVAGIGQRRDPDVAAEDLLEGDEIAFDGPGKGHIRRHLALRRHHRHHPAHPDRVPLRAALFRQGRHDRVGQGVIKLGVRSEELGVLIVNRVQSTD